MAEHPLIATPFVSIGEMVALNGRSRPHQDAFIEGDERIGWLDFDHAVNRVANALLERGLASGDRVALMGANTIWTYTLTFGVIRAGGVIVPLSTFLRGEAIRRLLDDSGADILFCGDGFEDLTAEVTTTLDPGALTIVTQSPSDHVDFEAFIGDATNDDPRVGNDPHALCNIVYSSGTTGLPKGIAHSHIARIGFGTQVAIGCRCGPDTRAVITTPPYTNGTWIFLLPTIMAGGTVILMDKFDVDGLFDIAERHRPTHVFMVPTQFMLIHEHPRFSVVDLSSFRCCLTGAAPMPLELKKALLDSPQMGSRLFELWGMTEGVMTLISPEELRERPQSVGRAATATELRLIDDRCDEIPLPGTGELVGRSSKMMSAYWGQPEMTEDLVWRDLNGRMFYRTGDIGEMDADGYVTIRGRVKDMIISGGLNVFPVDIESALVEHPDVRDAAVIGAPHRKWGETPVAFVIAQPGRTIDTDALKSFANERLGKHQRVHDIVVRGEDFPRNALQKVLKNELRDEYRELRDTTDQGETG